MWSRCVSTADDFSTCTRLTKQPTEHRDCQRKRCLADLIVRIEYRPATYGIHDTAVDELTTSVNMLLADKFEGLKSTEIRCYHTSYSRLQNLINNVFQGFCDDRQGYELG